MAAGGSSESIKILCQNEKDDFLEASEILLKFANNVLKDPNNSKFRRIRVGNPIITSKLLPVSGAVECLFDIGFQENDDGEYFVLPQTTALSKIIQVRDQLQKARELILVQNGKAGAKTSPGQLQPSIQRNGHPRYNTITMQTEAAFLKKLMSSFDHVLLYEDPNLRAKARQCMPLDMLQRQAIRKQSDLSEQGESVDLQDLLLLELLSWFKKDFFSWVDAPKCDHCGGKTQNLGMVPPLPAETMWGAGRVENYSCVPCGRQTRFPRYNHPGKLLETRKGRCGEWANCFTLCCRAAGFEARYVLDWTDHVWTEVFSESQNRWLHCDPCENTCDKPLVYEAGWNKKLSYIIAFSKDDIQDVTWRYSTKHQEVLSRRTKARESFVLNSVLRMRKNRQKDLPENRKQILKNRLIVELVEFLTDKSAGEGETEGRQSGSLAWRLARGETETQAVTEKHVIKPSPEEIRSKTVHIKYCCATDKYVRMNDGGKETSGWQKMVYEVKDIFRKVEHDWKQVYLARKEGTSSATITWKFDFQDTNCAVEKIDILALSACYEDGQVSWRLCGDEECAILNKDGQRTVINNLSGSKSLTLMAELRGGQGDCAWQHTQLFRQKDSDSKDFPFEINIKLCDN